MTVLTGANVAIDMADPIDFNALVASESVGTPSATAFSVQNPLTGELYEFTGAGFANFVDGFPTAGTITGLVYSVSSQPVLTLSNTSVSIAALMADLAVPNFAAALNRLFGNPDDITGSTQADDLRGYGGNDTIDGGDGNDIIDGLSGNDTLFGGLGNDDLSGGSSDDTLSGDDGNDILRGEDGADALSGGAGGDRLEGGEGDDVLNGGFGDDVISGGAGFDILSYADLAGALEVHLSDGFAFGFAGFDQITGVERVEGGTSDDVMFDSSGNDILSGNDGNDQLTAETGADQLLGGAGDDTFVARFNGSVDQIDGGAGVDTLRITGTGFSGIIVQFAAGYAANTDGQLIALISGIENVNHTEFSDALIGDASDNRLGFGWGADWIVGGDGDDWFVLSGADGQADNLFGGVPGADSGFDTIDFSGSTLTVNVHLSGYATANGTTIALFSGIEAALGSIQNDALIGTAANNRFTGGDGADWIVGAAGDDWFAQTTNIPSSADRLFGDEGVDTIDYSSVQVPPSLVVQLSGYATVNGALHATFTGIENAIGTAFADVLVGNASNNVITGGAGADWLVGGDGNDTFMQGIEAGAPDRLFGDAGVDTLDYSGASAGVTVQFSGYSASAGATLATFADIESAIGTSFNDALIGNASDNILTGGGGADWLVGGGGADTFVYKSIADGAGDSIRDFSQVENDLIDLSAIDADATLDGDQFFSFATSRTAGLVGEAVVTSASAAVTMLSLYLDADNVADMVVQIVHQPGLIMDASDFVL